MSRYQVMIVCVLYRLKAVSIVILSVMFPTRTANDKEVMQNAIATFAKSKPYEGECCLKHIETPYRGFQKNLKTCTFTETHYVWELSSYNNTHMQCFTEPS